jgi:hypothetical protein
MRRPYDPWKCRHCGALKSEGCNTEHLVPIPCPDGVTRYEHAACPLDLRFWWDRLLWKYFGILP